jgi:hypothetical protein
VKLARLAVSVPPESGSHERAATAYRGKTLARDTVPPPPVETRHILPEDGHHDEVTMAITKADRTFISEVEQMLNCISVPTPKKVKARGPRADDTCIVNGKLARCSCASVGPMSEQTGDKHCPVHWSGGF